MNKIFKSKNYLRKGVFPTADTDKRIHIPGDTVEIGVVDKPAYLFETHALNGLCAESIFNFLTYHIKTYFSRYFNRKYIDRSPFDSTL